MKKAASVLGLVLLGELATAPCAFGARSAHRPWLMVHSRSSAPPPRRVEPAKAVSPSVVTPSQVTGLPAGQAGSKAGQKIARRALEYKGTRYKFGGNSRRGLDCSGLVNRVYADLKMKKIPRASHALFKSGKPVKLGELRPGDLVFFKNTYRRGISHVGVYAGRNKFVHASNHRRGVTVTALSDPYYQLHYAGARRLY